jgi:hypothetical protein
MHRRNPIGLYRCAYISSSHAQPAQTVNTTPKSKMRVFDQLQARETERIMGAFVRSKYTLRSGALTEDNQKI